MPDEWNDPKETLDAVVLAGDLGAYKAVCGENKALLQVEGIPVIAYVISALQRCRYVTRIFVVGPRERILETLEREGIRGRGQKEVIVVEQWTSLIDNGWNTFLATLPAQGPDGSPLSEEALRERYEGKAVLFLGSDMPLLTHYELEEFIEGCDMQGYDYVAGTTPEEVLRPFYPEKGTPGIRLAYFHFKDSLERQNNLHMIRVFRVINPKYGQLMYRFRYQTKWKNMLLLLRELLAVPGLTLGMVFRFCLLHVCRVLGQIPWMPLNRLLRRFLDRDKLTEDIGAILQTRFTVAMTTYGGAALDVDDKEQLAVIGSQFHRWRALQEDHHGARTQPSSGASDPLNKAMP
jgi:molybdopterin-guanine dinucleotide biosynthesis protein A